MHIFCNYVRKKARKFENNAKHGNRNHGKQVTKNVFYNLPLLGSFHFTSNCWTAFLEDRSGCAQQKLYCYTKESLLESFTNIF